MNRNREQDLRFANDLGFAAVRKLLPCLDGVRPMHALENELPICEVPDGVFGFVTPWSADYVDPEEKLLEKSIHQRPGGTVEMLIVKDKAGILHAVGFMAELVADGVPKLPAKAGQAPKKALFFLRPTGHCENLAALRLDKVSLRLRHLPDGTSFFDVWPRGGFKKKKGWLW